MREDIRSNNDSENAPILAVNRKLGYLEDAVFLTFGKAL
jgi:hypothetical protein